VLVFPSFYCKNSKYKTGYYVNPGFSIGLHNKDLNLLEKIQSYFGGVGTICKQTKNSVQFIIFSAAKPLI